jgi:molybdopterin molybdotransferase
MISVQKAKELILQNTDLQEKIHEIPTKSALGSILARSIIAPIDLPSFDQSNVDGYAICGLSSNGIWEIIDEIKAGDNPSSLLSQGKCVRIFTGAQVPDLADAVIMQEQVDRAQNQITLKNEFEVKSGQQIRKRASQIKMGELALEKNFTLSAASLSFIYMLGIQLIDVYKKPIINLIVTGNELQFLGEKLQDGKVFEANSIAISSLLEQNGFQLGKLMFVNDDLEELKMIFKTCLEEADYILFSGGISVGEYDFVKQANEELGTESIFHKVAQKPGKPLFFGKNGKTKIFALPGNPASTLTCMYEYVLPSIRKYSRKKEFFQMQKRAKIDRNISKTANLAQFLKGFYENGTVNVLEGQDSFIMKSFSEANCLIYLPQEVEQVSEGDTVEIHMI